MQVGTVFFCSTQSGQHDFRTITNRDSNRDFEIFGCYFTDCCNRHWRDLISKQEKLQEERMVKTILNTILSEVESNGVMIHNLEDWLSNQIKTLSEMLKKSRIYAISFYEKVIAKMSQLDPFTDVDESLTLKIITLGQTSVGKTCLQQAYIHRRFSPNPKATIGLEYQTARMAIKMKSVNAQLWDYQSSCTITT